MTTEERLAKIKTKAERDAKAKVDAANAEAAERNKLIEEIRVMSERIEAVITLANACLNNEVEIPQAGVCASNKRSGELWGYPYEFIAEGIYHHTGLIIRNNTVEYIGIENGGANGPFDLWTDGYNVWYVHEENRDIKRDPGIKDLQKFLREFPQFEAAFLKFVDEM